MVLDKCYLENINHQHNSYKEKGEKKMTDWLNTKRIIKNNLKKEKPCSKLGYCPYGQLVEEFKIRQKRNNISCKTFGHDCPMFYHAEEITE